MSWIVYAIINPDNVSTLDSGPNKDYFPADVANRLPECLRVLGGVYCGIMLLGTFLVFPFKKEEEDQH